MKQDLPVQVACPHCSEPRARLFAIVQARTDYHCPRCGRFSVTGSQAEMFLIGSADPRQARFVDGPDGRVFLRFDELAPGQVWFPTIITDGSREILDLNKRIGGEVLVHYRTAEGDSHTTEQRFRVWLAQLDARRDRFPDD